MRSNQEVLDLILSFARERRDISYVIQNGSRVNPKVVPDMYADYDIIFGCGDGEKYDADRGWMRAFGEPLIVQVNRLQEGGRGWSIYLMQFKDGLRIDLQFYPGDGVGKYTSDSLSKILLDKTGIFKASFEPSEASYITRRPDQEAYEKAVNEFWWCAINVAKGLARNELCYSRFMYESIARAAFLDILSWLVGSRHGWRVNTGKFGKFLGKRLDPETWSRVEATYGTDTSEARWASLLNACSLVMDIDHELRPILGISGEPEDGRAIMKFIERIRDGQWARA